jgi:energy-coupling factor transporter transmembrane protein EcfT
MIVLKFIPILIEDTKRIIWAQKLRGWEITSKNPVNVVQQIGPIVMPLTGRVLRLIDDTEMSAVSRGFGLSKGVAILAFKAGRRDYVISIVAGALAITGVVALILFNAGSI